MASPQSSEHFGSRNKVQVFDHDPGATTAIICSPDGGTTKRVQDMRDYCGFAVCAMSSTLTGAGITKLEIVAADNSAMSTNLTVIKDSGTVAADAVGDFVYLECSAEEIAQESADAGATLRYVAARLTLANAADEAVVTYIAFGAKHIQTGLSATTIS